MTPVGCESPEYGLQRQAIHDLLDILLSITAWQQSVRNFRIASPTSLFIPNLASNGAEVIPSEEN